MLSPDILAQSDPELWNAIRLENQRQEDHVELIASENYVSTPVLIAQGSQLTNKYAEGYPGRRYYGGCDYVDMAESIAIERAKKLFGAPWANVQPHSGSQANQCAYTAVLKPGDTILGMSLAMGGHLTHGSPVNMSGKWFNVVSYGLDEAEAIDYAEMERLAHEHKPRIIIGDTTHGFGDLLDGHHAIEHRDEAALFEDLLDGHRGSRPIRIRRSRELPSPITAGLADPMGAWQRPQRPSGHDRSRAPRPAAVVPCQASTSPPGSSRRRARRRGGGRSRRESPRPAGRRGYGVRSFRLWRGGRGIDALATPRVVI